MPSRRCSAAERRGAALSARAWHALLVRQDSLGLVAGVDEAGRGPLAGPVVAAAVILDELQPIAGLADSKRLGPATRERLHDEIRAKALACCIAEASVQEIDRLDILQATLLAMQRAVQGLRIAPKRVWVDGNRAPGLPMPATAVVRGDATLAAVAAASILAKVHRDRLCLALDAAHPPYGFARHKGYPTPDHLDALRRLGPCAVHRRSCAPVRAAAAGAARAQPPAAPEGAPPP
jgi:ribonuclease HII